MIKFLRGSAINLLTDVEVDLKTEYPDLFPKDTISFANVSCPDDVQVVLVSSDNIESEPITLTSGVFLEISDVLLYNIKLKAGLDTTVNVFTGMESH